MCDFPGGESPLYVVVRPESVSKPHGGILSQVEIWFSVRDALKEAGLQNPALTLRQAQCKLRQAQCKLRQAQSKLHRNGI